MLLGWHYSDYYFNAYAMNQYLASRGFIVLSVNYRLGICYGHDFHRSPNAGPQGASEYQDLKAAGEYLRTRPQVDPKRIGIYGGCYGGVLTALALARDSGVFAAGVAIHASTTGRPSAPNPYWRIVRQNHPTLKGARPRLAIIPHLFNWHVTRLSMATGTRFFDRYVTRFLNRNLGSPLPIHGRRSQRPFQPNHRHSLTPRKVGVTFEDS